MTTEKTVREYHPHPIDVSDVQLDGELMELSEILAENVHEVWSAARLAEGWRYGDRRDDAARLHPGLVPYSELSDKEKEYDRLTAVNTLRLVVKLGFTISRRDTLPCGSNGIPPKEVL